MASVRPSPPLLLKDKADTISDAAGDILFNLLRIMVVAIREGKGKPEWQKEWFSQDLNRPGVQLLFWENAEKGGPFRIQILEAPQYADPLLLGMMAGLWLGLRPHEMPVAVAAMGEAWEKFKRDQSTQTRIEIPTGRPGYFVSARIPPVLLEARTAKARSLRRLGRGRRERKDRDLDDADEDGESDWVDEE